MAAIIFPASPSNNDTFTSGGKTWQWNGTFWSLVVSGASFADGSVSTAKIADSAITAAKIADGTVVAAEIANNAITTDKIAAGAVTAAKLGNDISLTPADGSITQAKLAATLSGITVTTTANRSTDVASPFTGQTIFLSDVTRLQVWNGSAWTFITNGAPGAPTSLSATALSTTSVSVSFTPGESAGASPINYKYSLSTNGGSTYGEPTALDPTDVASPVTISGLTGGQTYYIKLRAVSDFGDSPDSTATSVAVPTVPSAPTSLSATSLSTTSVSVSFTPGADGGSAITNYQYALSTNSGSTYGSFTALNPADATTPITITGLTEGTAYSVKLKAVSDFGASAESAAVSVTTLFTVDYLVVAGGASGGSEYGGGGGAGGLRSTVTATGGGGSLETALTMALSTNVTVTVGGGGASFNGDGTAIVGNNGSNSVFDTVTSIGGGGGGARYHTSLPPNSGGSGGGASDNNSGAAQEGAAGEPNQGYAGGGTLVGNRRNYRGHGGGGAGAVGGNSPSPTNGDGGVGVAVAITGSSVFYAGGGGGGEHSGGSSGGAGGNGGGGAGGYGTSTSGVSGGENTGGGGGAGGDTGSGTIVGTGGSGVVILRWLISSGTITVGAGLTADATTTSGSYYIKRITAGSGTVSWT